MDWEDFRKVGKQVVDFISDYHATVRDRRVFPDVQPGYLRNLLPSRAPEKPEPWEKVFQDFNKIILPGITHWQSPHFHGYFPSLTSPPSVLGDLIADGICTIGFTWASSPASTELESLVLDWLGQAIGLPNDFLKLSKDSKGGGVIQTSASEATLCALLAGRGVAIRKHRETFPNLDDSEINAMLVGYCSQEAHSSVEKAGLIALMKMRLVETDDDLSMRGNTLSEFIKKDKEAGLIPTFVCCSLGTTGAVAFDNLAEIGPIAKKEDMWLHVDSAYAGASFFCPEFRKWTKGIEAADSFVFNPAKWMMVHFDCTAFWVKDATMLHKVFNVSPLYLQHEKTGMAIDYMHWQIPLSRRFRALKLWFVMRIFGIENLQRHIRRNVKLAEQLEKLMTMDSRFEIPAKRHLGLIVFRLNGENELTEMLLKRVNATGKTHFVPTIFKGKYVIRFTVSSTYTTEADLKRDWKIVQDCATELLDEVGGGKKDRMKSMEDLKKRKDGFGSTLVMSNVTTTPKVINGSYLALFEDKDAMMELAKQITKLQKEANLSPMLSKGRLNKSIDEKMKMAKQGHCTSCGQKMGGSRSNTNLR